MDELKSKIARLEYYSTGRANVETFRHLCPIEDVIVERYLPKLRGEAFKPYGREYFASYQEALVEARILKSFFREKSISLKNENKTQVKDG